MYLSNAERIELRLAEMAATCGPIGYLPSNDSWRLGITEWVNFCGKVAQFNPQYGWSHGCTAGKRIGSKVKTSSGSFQLLASNINWLDN